MPNARRWVLLVDDDVDACDILASLLERHHLRTRCVHNGSEAIELLTQLAEAPDTLPSAVVTDLLMPGIVGSSVVAYLESDPRLRDVEVAVMTASPDLAPQGHVLFPKPVAVSKLIDFVDGAISRVP